MPRLIASITTRTDFYNQRKTARCAVSTGADPLQVFTQKTTGSAGEASAATVKLFGAQTDFVIKNQEPGKSHLHFQFHRNGTSFAAVRYLL